MKSLCFVCSATLSGCKNNDFVKRGCSDQPTIISELSFARLSWLGHLGLITDDRLPKKLLSCQVVGNN